MAGSLVVVTMSSEENEVEGSAAVEEVEALEMVDTAAADGFFLGLFPESLV